MIGKVLIIVVVCFGLVNHFSKPTVASEMDVTVGIEFENKAKEKEPQTSSDTSILKGKPNIKLPKTGELSGRSGLLAGGILIIWSSILLRINRKKVSEK